jgi:hypothetical protein
MHHRTFQEITKRIDALVVQYQALSPLLRRLGRNIAGLERQLSATGVIGYSDGSPFGAPIVESGWRTSS